jgi:cation transporter-like permease
MSEKTEVAKEFAKIAREGLLVAFSLLALNGAVVYALTVWLGVELPVSILLGSAIVMVFVLVTGALTFSYELAKSRVARRRRKSQ